MFEYDSSAALDVREASIEARGASLVHDLSYASPTRGRVSAYLVEPAGDARPAGAALSAAVIFLHWGQGDRTTFLPEALAYAESGVAALLIDESPLRHFSIPNQMTPEGARDYIIQCVTDLRRGVDLLISRETVDANRIGYVGHSLGSSMGGQFAGVEKRVKAHVLMGGWADSTRKSAELAHLMLRTSREEFLRVAGGFNAEHFVGDAAPSAILFQYARRDEVISERDAARYFAAASEPKELRWYDATHEFNLDARCDRAAWLGDKLGFTPPDANRLSKVHLPQRDIEYWRGVAPALRMALAGIGDA